MALTQQKVHRYFVSRLSAVVCSVGYRLAPEDPFPAAPEDALDAVLALLDMKAPYYFWPLRRVSPSGPS